MELSCSPTQKLQRLDVCYFILICSGVRLTYQGTTQACLFRDDYDTLTATGLAIYGLSTDSPKSNTAFKAKQSLPYTLLCDPRATLVEAIGLKKSPRGTTRGVFVVDKAGKVQAATPGVWNQPGPHFVCNN